MSIVEIESRVVADRDDFAEGYTDQSIRDREHLLAVVKAQQAVIDAVRNLANTRGRSGWQISPNDIRTTLETHNEQSETEELA